MSLWDRITSTVSRVYHRVDSSIFGGRLPAGSPSPSEQSSSNTSQASSTSTSTNSGNQPTTQIVANKNTSTKDIAKAINKTGKTVTSGGSAPKTVYVSSSGGGSSSSGSSRIEQLNQDLKDKLTGKKLDEQVSKVEKTVNSSLPQTTTTSITYNNIGEPILTKSKENVVSYYASSVNTEANKPYKPDMTPKEQTIRTGAGVANLGIGAVSSIYGVVRHPIQTVKGVLRPDKVFVGISQNIVQNPTRGLGGVLVMAGLNAKSLTYSPKAKVTTEVNANKIYTSTSKGKTIGLGESKFIIKLGQAYYKYKTKSGFTGTKLNKDTSAVTGQGKVIDSSGKITDYMYQGITKENTITHLNPKLMIQRKAKGYSTTGIIGTSPYGNYQSVSVAKSQNIKITNTGAKTQTTYYTTKSLTTSDKGANIAKGASEVTQLLKDNSKSSQSSQYNPSKTGTTSIHKQDIKPASASFEIAKEIAKQDVINKQTSKTNTITNAGQASISKQSSNVEQSKKVVSFNIPIQSQSLSISKEKSYGNSRPPQFITSTPQTTKTKISTTPVIIDTPQNKDMLKFIPSIDTPQKQNQDPLIKPIQDTPQKQIPDPITKQPQKQIPKPAIKTPQKQILKPALTPPNYPAQAIGFNFNPNLTFGFGFSKSEDGNKLRKSFSFKQPTQPKRYTPSFSSIASGFKGTPTKAGTFSGLGIRPIPITKKKKNKQFGGFSL